MSKGKKSENRWGLVAVIGGVIVFALVISYLAIRKHNAFSSGYDLGNMDQTVWNTSKGYFFELSEKEGTVSRFKIHADIILAVIAPLYWIWEDVRVLLILQAVGLAVAAIPIYLITKKILKSEVMAVGVAAAYLINPWTQWIGIYDFHGVALAIPLLLAGFYLMLIKKWGWMWVVMIFAMMTKENVGLEVAMIGIVTLFYREYLQGLMMIFGGMFWSLSMVFGVMPYMGGGEHWGWDWFTVKPDQIGGDKKVLARRLWDMVKIFWRWDSIDYYKKLLDPLGYLPLFGLPLMVIGLPQLGLNVISLFPPTRSVNNHNHSLILVAMMLAVVYGLYYVKVTGGKLLGERLTNIALWGLVIYLVASAARMNYFYSPLPTTRGLWKPIYEVTADEVAFEKALKEIPEDAVVTSSSEIRPHVTHRRNSFNLSAGIETAEYVAMIDQNRLVGDLEPKPLETFLIAKFQEEGTHEVVANFGHFWLFKRK